MGQLANATEFEVNNPSLCQKQVLGDATNSICHLWWYSNLHSSKPNMFHSSSSGSINGQGHIQLTNAYFFLWRNLSQKKERERGRKLSFVPWRCSPNFYRAQRTLMNSYGVWMWSHWHGKYVHHLSWIIFPITKYSGFQSVGVNSPFSDIQSSSRHCPKLGTVLV